MRLSLHALHARRSRVVQLVQQRIEKIDVMLFMLFAVEIYSKHFLSWRRKRLFKRPKHADFEEKHGKKTFFFFFFLNYKILNAFECLSRVRGTCRYLRRALALLTEAAQDILV